MIRQDDLPVPARPRHGDLPDQWSDSLNHELTLALAVSVQSAEKTALTAWELGTRLPGIAALHADGMLAYAKARLIAETFEQLSDEDAARQPARTWRYCSPATVRRMRATIWSASSSVIS